MLQWKQFEDLNQGEIELVRKYAREFYEQHKDHVLSIYLGLSETDAVAPSGSDMFRPELWKGIHWKWFVLTYKDIEIKAPATIGLKTKVFFITMALWISSIAVAMTINNDKLGMYVTLFFMSVMGVLAVLNNFTSIFKED